MAGPITRVRWRSYAVPFREVARAAHGVQSLREGLVVEIETADGLTGLGEAAPLPSYTGGDVAETACAVRQIAARITGVDAPTAWARPVALDGYSPGAAAAARCGVETALADLCARAEGVTLARWLARAADLPAGDATARIPVNAIVDTPDPKQAGAEAAHLAACGFGTIKVKVGIDHESDFARVRAVREGAGPGVAIRVDANGAWPFEAARSMLAALAPLGVALCEQPLAPGPDAIARHAKLRAGSPVPFALDESCRTPEDVDALVAAGAADALVLKPMASGLRASLAMVAAARRAGLPVIVTTMFDAGPGVAAAANVAALTAPQPLAAGLATLDRLVDDLVEAAPPIAGGVLQLPCGPGLGVRLDEAALARYAGSIAGEAVA